MRLVGRLVLDRRVDNFFAETEQVAFCTQNIVPGIDFSNDPLLQGRNFSYLDTQLKRLGSPNFTHIPINAPKCPFAHFQQDGHMAMRNPKGRVNYEPNSWTDGGPRESPELGFQSYPEPVEGPKVRARSETFADHYSQARQFYISQTEIEQQHIANALTFELSKVETPAIRARMVSHLLNIDDGLAETVAKGLRLKEMPKPATAARPTRQDLKPSPKLSIIKNGPKSFAGRKVGALVTDGVDADVLAALGKALKAEGAMLKLVAPEVGGVKDSDGHLARRRREARRRPVRPLRRRRDPALQGGCVAADHAPRRPRLRRRRRRAPEVHRLRGRRRPAAGEGGRRPRRGLHPPQQAPATATASSPPAASSASGTAPPPSGKPTDRGRETRHSSPRHRFRSASMQRLPIRRITDDEPDETIPPFRHRRRAPVRHRRPREGFFDSGRSGAPSSGSARSRRPCGRPSRSAARRPLAAASRSATPSRSGPESRAVTTTARSPVFPQVTCGSSGPGPSRGRSIGCPPLRLHGRCRPDRRPDARRPEPAARFRLVAPCAELFVNRSLHSPESGSIPGAEVPGSIRSPPSGWSSATHQTRSLN